MRQDNISNTNMNMNKLLRMDFFTKIDVDTLLTIFDCFNDICFFIKDTEGRLIAANTQLLKRYGLTNESDIIGKTDFDFVPRSLAEKYKKDDIKILDSKTTILNILELALNPVGIPGWFITNKFPVIAKDKSIIGIMGTISKLNNGQIANDTNNLFYNILKYIDNNFNKKLSVEKLAHYFNVSTRSIERYFNQYLNISPELFIIKTRIFKSCDYLRKGINISIVAAECGFYDQSSFTKHFKKHMGLTPLQYVKKYIDINLNL